MEEEQEEKNEWLAPLPRPHWYCTSDSTYSISLLLSQLVTSSHAFSLTSILTCRQHPIMSLLMYRDMLHIQRMLLANERNKWDATFLPPFHAFAELTLFRLKVRACEKHLLHAALYTSIYPFIFSPVPPHAGWKMWTSASAAEEARSVLPQSVTNASLDTWRGHSSPLSPGHSVPLRHLPSHTRTHTYMDFYTFT